MHLHFCVVRCSILMCFTLCVMWGQHTREVARMWMSEDSSVELVLSTFPWNLEAELQLPGDAQSSLACPVYRLSFYIFLK